MIPVTKPYLPNRAKLEKYIDSIYERSWLTNNGPLTQLLTERLQEYLSVSNLLLVNNGTIALQIAYSVLGVKAYKAEAITTPFSFVATSSTLKWEGITPIFSDINSETFCLNPSLLENSITKETRAIVPVHVFGNACDVESIQKVAQKHKLKTVYDGAHAFGVKYKNHSLLNFGDATTLSFHATKLFHSIEGGAIIFKDQADLEKAKKEINFGIDAPDSICGLGINAKMNEFQAAMGLCVLDEITFISEQRASLWYMYQTHLKEHFQLQKLNVHASNNYAYFPIIFKSEQALLRALKTLNDQDIYPRRYFYPSLDTLKYVAPCKSQLISRSIANKILCLPLYPSLDKHTTKKIISSLVKSI